LQWTTEIASFLVSVDFRNRLEGRLPHLLLLVAVAELCVYRLLVPGLRGGVNVEPPLWHWALTYTGLFLFYFASALAVGVVGHQLWQIFRGRDSHAWMLTWLVVPAGAAFLVLACISIVAAPSAGVTFLLEASVVVAILTVVAAQTTRKGDLGARIGLLFLALPLVIHFYVPFVEKFVREDILFTGISDQMESAGFWLVLFSALTMPYCFGARPFFLRAARLGPVAAGLAVGVSGALLVRTDYVKGLELAQNGFGIAVAPAAPSSLVALSLLALSAVAWTLASCLTVPSKHRRLIGVGIGLVVVGGYGFAWPLQYLVGLAGLLSISRGATRVQTEERAGLVASQLSVPPIKDEHWQSYIESLLEDLRDSESTETKQGSTVTIRGEAGQQRTHFVYHRDDIAVTVTVERVAGVVHGLDVRFASEGPDHDPNAEEQGAPQWTLHSFPPSPLGLVHPAPPECVGEEYRAQGSDFADHFLVCDAGGWTDALLDDKLRDRMVQEVHGWLACWADGTLRFQVYPARGAPLDSPIPISALSFQSGDESNASMLSLLDFLLQIAQRAAQHASDGESKDRA
jgi:hypothetical protein